MPNTVQQEKKMFSRSPDLNESIYWMKRFFRTDKNFFWHQINKLKSQVNSIQSFKEVQNPNFKLKNGTEWKIEVYFTKTNSYLINIIK